ncbi:MAG: hypothetical protein DYG99_04445 [Bacteroidetes bacterium CHB5]|nr:hypothetical protein [Bacteroidetes bacterium CHB5]
MGFELLDIGVFYFFFQMPSGLVVSFFVQELKVAEHAHRKKRPATLKYLLFIWVCFKGLKFTRCKIEREDAMPGMAD